MPRKRHLFYTYYVHVLSAHQLLSHVRFFATPWTIACQTPLSMGFFRQEYWSGLPFPSPGDLPDPGIEPAAPTLEGRFFITEPPGEALTVYLAISNS